MAKFVTIGYGDREGYDRTERALREAAHEHDARLQAEGADMGAAGTPAQVRNHEAAGVATESGPFMRSSLPVAGFAVIEAATMADAVEVVSRTPCAVAHGVVEVWPLESADGLAYALLCQVTRKVKYSTVHPSRVSWSRATTSAVNPCSVMRSVK